MKKFLSCLILSLLLCGTVWAAPINGDIDGHAIVKVRVNGVEVNSEVPAMLYKDSTLLPLRVVSEALGAKVEWNQDSYSVDITMPQPMPTATPTPTPKAEQPKLSQAEIERISKSVARIYVYDKDEKPLGNGSGFIIDGGKHGKLLITNCHVACIGPNLRVEVNGEVNGEVIGVRNEALFKNETTDIYAVNIATSAPALPYQTAIPQDGAAVTAIGYPNAVFQTANGHIIGIERVEGVDMITHDATLGHGSSGGVLLNQQGEAIDITTGGYDGTSKNEATPLSDAQKELDKLK